LPEYQLNNLVNVYSSGHSDETRITKFPINEAPFVGNIHEIKRQECETLPLEFEMKNVGYYEHLPSVTTEEGKKPGMFDKISNLFKEDVRSDYPQVTGMNLESFELFKSPLFSSILWTCIRNQPPY